jgi:hypothetical protein
VNQDDKPKNVLVEYCCPIIVLCHDLNRIEEEKEKLVSRELQNIAHKEADEKLLAALRDCPFDLNTESLLLPKGFERPSIPSVRSLKNPFSRS